MLLVAILLLLNFQHCESVFVNSQVMLLFPSMKMLLLKERRTLLGTNKNSTRGLTQEQIQGFLAFIHTYQLVSVSNSHLAKPCSSSTYFQVSNRSCFLIYSSVGCHLSLSCVSKYNLWIIDLGATDHITHSFTFFSSYISISPIPVTLPNTIVKKLLTFILHLLFPNT